MGNKFLDSTAFVNEDWDWKIIPSNSWTVPIMSRSDCLYGRASGNVSGFVGGILNPPASRYSLDLLCCFSFLLVSRGEDDVSFHIIYISFLMSFIALFIMFNSCVNSSLNALSCSFSSMHSFLYMRMHPARILYIRFYRCLNRTCLTCNRFRHFKEILF